MSSLVAARFFCCNLPEAPGLPGSGSVFRPMTLTVPTTLSLSYDLNLFIQDAVNNRPNTILSGWYLTNVFSGFEIWRGGVNLESTSFCAIVN